MGAKDNKISKDMAELDFNKFTEKMDLDVNTEGMSVDDKRDFTVQKDRLVRCIMEGSLVIDEEGQPIYTPQRAGVDVNSITFYEPTGASYIAMDRKKAGEDMGKMFATMADITKTSSGLFAKMKNTDLKVCIAMTLLFLA